jgi:phosphoglycerate dehydrogenase-like enzyme
MPDSLASSLVLVHQLPERLAPLLASLPGVTLRALPPERAWEVPEEAEILFAVPPRGGNVVVPAQKPPGWPGRLRWLHMVSAGIDEFPPWAFEVPLVTCGRGTNSAAIAEFTLASLLAVEKQLPQSWIHQAEGWTPRPGLGTLRGKVLGLLGFGSIGQAIAALAVPFGMEVLAHRRGSFEAPPGVSFTTLDDVLARADHLVIALPLTAATAGLIGRAALARTKRGVHLVNIARGRILDHEALLAALESGQVGFASLDVTEPEPLPPGHALYTHPRVHLSPHISWGGSNPAAQINLLQENLHRFTAGETLLNIVPPGRGY